MFVLGAQLRIAGDGGCHRLHERPAQPLVALLDDFAVIGLAAGGIGRRYKPGIGGKLFGLRNRDMSSISASISRAKNSPMPGIVFNSLTLALALVIAGIVAKAGILFC